jgi:glycosyltransferase involved in cell wall biosynthesis
MEGIGRKRTSMAPESKINGGQFMCSEPEPMRKTKICIISAVHIWNDTRVFYKEAVSLAQIYDVELHAVADFKHRLESGVNVYGLPKHRSRILRFLNSIVLCYRIVRSKPKVIHFHDPELILLGIFLKFFMDVKVVYDIHEDYSKTVIEKAWIPAPLRKPVAFIFDKAERFACRFFDANVVVLEGWCSKYPNAVLVRNFSFLAPESDYTSQERQKRLVYVGGLSAKRGAMEMLKAFDIVSAKHSDVSFDIVGSWSDKELESRAMKIIETNDMINYHGYLPLTEFKALVQKARLGFCLYTMPKYEENIPVKMFEYIAHGTPVVCSGFSSWRKTVEGEGWGICVDPFDAEEVADAVVQAMDDKRFEELSGNIVKHRTKYTWDNEEKNLLGLYERLSC